MMMKTLRMILGDQLSLDISSLRNANLAEDVIFMCEVYDEATHVKHHKKKLAFLFSAMRHFSIELRKYGYNVDYINLEDKNNTGSFYTELKRSIYYHQPKEIIVTHPGEYRVLKIFCDLQEELAIPLTIYPDDRFICSINEFSEWAKHYKQLRLEYFYRHMRKKHNILMKNINTPVGDIWNFDTKNRKPLKNKKIIPKPYYNKIDTITQSVISLVQKNFPNHFGILDDFQYAVTRKEALDALTLFIKERLYFFGDYQDAMVENEPWLFHSHLSLYLNCGLLTPLECIKKAEQAFHNKQAPLNAVEGFIRQILGWREFIHGVYWYTMPKYALTNYFNARKPLPEFYWNGETNMNCMKQSILETRNNAYAHHIQRLMVLGNFSLLAGIDPLYVNEWFLVVYADAYEWVELPNVNGMILFADGGFLASKPYAASGKYINKMSNYCETCCYDVNKKIGPNACPFNFLYWDFLNRNKDKLLNNKRISMAFISWDNMSEDIKQNILKESEAFLSSLKYAYY